MAEPALASSMTPMRERGSAWLRQWQELPPTRRWIAVSIAGACLLGGVVALLVAGARPAAPEPVHADVLRDALAELPPSDAVAAQDPAGEASPERVAAALRERTIRALDILLVAPESTQAMPYPAAEAHCRDLHVEGLGGWRLPELGELGSLTRAEMLGPHRYWSQTPADTFGDERMVWWAKRQRTVPAVEAAHVVCVRASNAP